MSREDEALADDARALLSAYRAEEGLPADVRARVWSRVDRSMHAEPEAIVVSPSRARWAMLGLAVAAAIAALWWGRARPSESPSEASPSAAAFDRDDARTHEAEATTTRDTTPAIPPTLAPAIPPTPADAAMRAPARAATPASPDAPARPAARAASRATTEVDALADEMELVRAAQSALARNDATHALALLEAGQRRFGAGTLAEERAAMHVLALCGAGKRSKARSEADAFAAAHPRSPLLPRVRAACGDATP